MTRPIADIASHLVSVVVLIIVVVVVVVVLVSVVIPVPTRTSPVVPVGRSVAHCEVGH